MGNIEDFTVSELFAADVDFEPQAIYRVKSPPGAIPDVSRRGFGVQFPQILFRFYEMYCPELSF
jgi:hypothetical protein